MNCLNCSKETSNPKFCSHSCSATFTQKGKPSHNKRNPLNYCPKCDRRKRKSVELCRRCAPKKKRTYNQYREYNSKFNLNKYRSRRREAIKYLGGKCVKCGTIENLEIDHIAPSKKSFSVGQAYSVNIERFFQEVDKCQLLCKEHHIEKTKYQYGTPDSEICGTPSTI